VAEELIYQFTKTVTAISKSPGDPVTDYADVASFFRMVEEYKLSTSLINGLENKEKLDEILLKAQNLLNKLETTPQFQEYCSQKEAARLKREGRQERLKMNQYESERLKEEEASYK
jgi:hypothetical protein